MDQNAPEPMVYRINLLDEAGIVSILAPAHGPKMITALAGAGVSTNRELLHALAEMDSAWSLRVLHQLARFDEFNVDEISPEWETLILGHDTTTHPAFRVIDSTTRARSLQPARLGIILFNLNERRIIQVENSGFSIQRTGTGRFRTNGEPGNRIYHYALPQDWTLLP